MTSNSLNAEELLKTVTKVITNVPKTTLKNYFIRHCSHEKNEKSLKGVASEWKKFAPDYVEFKKKFFEQSDLSWNREFLKREKINYIYMAKKEIEKPLDLEKNGLERFFENDEIIIYAIK